MTQHTHYPQGFRGGVTLRGAPILNAYSNNTFWVDSNATTSGRGTFDSPFTTLDRCFDNGVCQASRGDVILIKAGHAETLTAASAITCDVAGVAIIGLGGGANRPTFTFSTAAGASIVISAANVSIENIVGVSGIDALTNPFHVQAAGCNLAIEWQDPSSSLQAVRTVLTTDAADNLRVTLKTAGIISGGTAPVNAIRLVGCAGGIINLDFYGRASTAVVEFLTTACTNVEVYGYMYNSGVTDNTKDVIDTVTGSTWFASFFDGAAGYPVSGGSAAALAGDDVSTVVANESVPAADATTNTLSRDVIGNKTDAAVQAIAANKSLVGYLKGVVDALMGTAGIAAFPAAAAAANAVSLAEVIRYISESQLAVPAADATANVDAADVIGNKTDALVQAVGADKSAAAYLKGIVDGLMGSGGIATFPASADPANGVSLAEVVRSIWDAQQGSAGIVTFPAAAVPANAVSMAEVLRATFNLTSGGIVKTVSSVTTANLFTVAGGAVKIINIVGYITTAIQNQANNTKLVYTPTGGTATDVCAVLDVANAGQFGLLTITGTFANALVLTATAGIKAGVQAAPFIATPGILSLNCAATNTGAIDWYIEYQVMDIDATVVAS